ncbi:carboxypeptidase-like regulatory domain-containing protein [Hymenobacter koreensis]|uniref:Carboxypeptidase regulatory-like domain-containing protein n=1 Tax=Hymenobacter koreensis TaxID=1084523 RepID=A0ABP8JJ04_9BACT
MKQLATLTIGLFFGVVSAQAQEQAARADTARNAAPVAPPNPAVLECNTLVGRVTDVFDYPLTGATVMLRGRNNSFSTDAFSTNSDGRYLITSKKPIPRNTVLQVTAGGYNSVEQPLANCKPLDISLELLPGTKLKSDGRIKKTSSTGKIK